MLNTEAVASVTRWQPPVVRAVRQTARDNLWSSFEELASLLRYDGQVQSQTDKSCFRRKRFEAGQTVFNMGDAFDGLYVVRLGALKTSITYADGGQHVLAFPMRGDLVGFDGTCKNQYLSEVVTLNSCELIKIPSGGFFSPGRGCNDLERMVYWAMSREIVHEQTAYSLSHIAKAEARVARFLLVQSERFAEMGYSPVRFSLPMTRRDIGNYLAITLETVSRALSALDHLGIISVERREIVIVSPEALSEFEG